MDFILIFFPVSVILVIFAFKIVIKDELNK